jgi:superfamily I DNA and RNA helicase
MKAAHLHLSNPDAQILVTFFTKSLNETIKSLITKFYRHYRDADPDWAMIHIRHGWGGSSKEGVYSDACRRAGLSPMTLSDAKVFATRDKEPFDVVCQHLIDNASIEKFYDHVLIDEGQDFPSSFYKLAYSITKGQRDRKNIVWAYDELQNILNVKIRSPEELFGTASDGQPVVSLDRAAQGLPKGAENDILLSKCYRNQREVLVVAHALGFGIYHDIVQLLESAEHWEDVGYRLREGNLAQLGSDIVIERPAENSPISLDGVTGFPLIDTYAAEDLVGECAWAVDQIRRFIAGGLHPQDIIVISLDDRNARAYFKQLSTDLASTGINTHNLLGDPYSDPPFFVEGRVTLSTIYKAKGNEAPAVIILGLDGAGRRTRSGRNKVFTAFTRSKAWLRVSGIGSIAVGLIGEVAIALQNFPFLRFKMPDLQQVEFIQRDLSKKQAKLKRIREQYLRELQRQGFTEDQAKELLSEDAGGATRNSQ